MKKTTRCPARLSVLHADTPLKSDLYDLPLSSPALALRLTSRVFPGGTNALAAIWCLEGRSDQACLFDLYRIAASFREKCEAAGIPKERVPLSVEDLRLIGNDLSVLDELSKIGVLSVIPFWRGENALGGAWDTEKGLTDFGRAAIARCLALGLIPDVSHASRQSTDGILSLCERAGKVAIASHVGFDGLCPHGRNLTDRDAFRIANLGGLVGITFHAPHLSPTGRASTADVTRHLLYGFARFPDAIALGADFDGTDELPEGLPTSDALPSLAAALSSAGLSDRAIDAIFFRNAERFFSRVGLSTRF